jgi:AcrR family transcriptional regulator
MQSRPAQRKAREAPGSNRERIVAGARRHFFAHGFRSVTMSDLATELGMSKKTLYIHFPGKTALLEAMIDDKLGHIHADLTEVMEAEKTAFPERLQRLLAGLRKHTAEIQPAFVRDVRKDSPKLFARIQQGRRKLIHRCFGKLLEDGRKAGAIRTDIPMKLLIEMLIGTVDAVLVPARMEELGITPRTGLAQIIAVFLEGVLVRKGGAR